MSAEQITNRNHIEKLTREQQYQNDLIKQKQELHQLNKQQKVQRVDPDETLYTSNIQRLISEQSDAVKQQITKKTT